jgi:PPOX class probable F420-dependent enzyme
MTATPRDIRQRREGPVSGPAGTAGSGHRYVTATTALTGSLTVAAGLWALLAPGSFADFTGFPASTHFVHDAGAFQLGIGTTLLLAPAWRDGPALALTGFLVANTVHAVNHALDLGIGGDGWVPWGLAALSLVTGGALLTRLRQLGYVVGEVATATTPVLAPFVRQKTILLTTYRRDGTPVGTPVSIAVDGDRAVVRSFEKAWKTRRIANDPMVEIAPATTRGRTTGPAMRARARRLAGAESDQAARLLAAKHPLLHGIVVPLIHRLGRSKTGRTVHFELTPSRPDPGGEGT